MERDAAIGLCGDIAVIKRLKQRASSLKSETYALHLAARDPRTPWYAKLLVAGIVAYALSPIDLVPDFIPVVGYLDDLILIPMAIALALRLIPPHVMAECRSKARETMQNRRPVSWVAGAVIVAVWLAVAAFAVTWAYHACMALW